MAKSKTSMKDLFLKKGEYIALGIAGFGLVVMLLWGVMTGLGAADPDKISKDLSSSAQRVNSALAVSDPEADNAKPEPLPDWVQKQMTNTPVNTDHFQLYGPLFDPIAKPETKRENPRVLGISEYQLDLIRAPMKAFDITFDDPPKIAVKVTKVKGKSDTQGVKDTLRLLKTKGRDAQKRVMKSIEKRKKREKAMGAAGMGPFGMGPGGEQPGPGGGGDFGGEPGGYPGGMYSGSYSFGMGTESGYDQSAQRTETAITYVPLESVDQVTGEGKVPAMTVVPLRMAVINAEIPFKLQLEEVKRAMRLQDWRQAYPYVRFDGFNVKRQVSYTRSDGKVTIVQPWADYDYVSKYIELIDARKMGDYFEGSDPSRPDDAYLPYFYRYEDALVMPLPELVSELGSYPVIDKLASIKETIAKLKDAATPKVEASELAKRLTKQKPVGGTRDLFRPKTINQTGAANFYDPSTFMGPNMDSMKTGMGGMGGVDGMQMMPQIDINHLLLRFVDCDIKPGFTYEYQIQVRMINPNFGYPKSMANPKQALEEQYRVLTSPWVQLRDALRVPSESFLYAYDATKYRNDIDNDYKSSQRELHKRLQARDDQAVVQAATWLEEVRTDAGNQREPIGGWVLAEMPVSRGAFIGKKTYVKLPLWSSELNQYVLREMPANTVVRGGIKNQPKGWLVDFSSRSILVDFEGGKSRMKAGNRPYEEEVATEMLILRPDGKLQVRRSDIDMDDANRIKLSDDWKKWIETVEQRKLPSGMGPDNMFERKLGSPGS